MAKAVPEGMHTLTAQLSIDGAAKAIEWFKQAFGAEEMNRAADPSGTKVWHAAIRIGDSVLFVNDVFPDMGSSGPNHATLWVYGDKVDERWKRAVDAGAKVQMPLTDMFWGDRMGTLADPFGNRWVLSQHVKDLSPAEMQAAQEAFVASMPKKN
jgi:uncharacterized glyoxalase superfamily protein PhnB